MIGNLNMYNFSLAKVNNQLLFILLNYFAVLFIYKGEDIYEKIIQW